MLARAVILSSRFSVALVFCFLAPGVWGGRGTLRKCLQDGIKRASGVKLLV